MFKKIKGKLKRVFNRDKKSDKKAFNPYTSLNRKTPEFNPEMRNTYTPTFGDVFKSHNDTLDFDKIKEFHDLVIKGNVSSVENFLGKHGNAFVNKRHPEWESGDTPLMNAVQMHGILAISTERIHYEKIIRILVEKGADVNARDNEGHTVLYHAYSYAAGKEVTQFLLRNGARLASGGTSYDEFQKGLIQEQIAKEQKRQRTEWERGRPERERLERNKQADLAWLEIINQQKQGRDQQNKLPEQAPQHTANLESRLNQKEAENRKLRDELERARSEVIQWRGRVHRP